MKAIDLQPNTAEWLAWHQNKLTASDAPVIMGVSAPWRTAQTWESLKAHKAGNVPGAGAWATEAWEHLLKDGESALSKLDEGAGVYKPACLEMTSDSRFSAGIDGLLETFQDEFRGLWVEISHPPNYGGPKPGDIDALLQTSRDERELLLRERWSYTYWRLVQQAAVVAEDLKVSDRHTCVLFSVGMEQREKCVHLSVRNLLRDWPRLQAEWERYLSGTGQYRADAEWAAAVAQYETSLGNLELAAQAERQARDNMIRIAGGETAGCGYAVALIKHGGLINWEAVALELASGDEEMVKGIAKNYCSPSGESLQVLPHKNSA